MNQDDIDKADLQKIHNEINQIVNQRFVITTVAIAFFGVIVTLMNPKNNQIVDSENVAFIFIASILLTLSLLFFFSYSYWLKRQLRIFTTYLLVKKISNWERWYLGYTKPQAIFFLFLGFISFLLPFIFMWVYSVGCTVQILLLSVVNTFIFAVYFFLIYVMGFTKKWDNEPEAKKRWDKIIQESDKTSK